MTVVKGDPNIDKRIETTHKNFKDITEKFKVAMKGMYNSLEISSGTKSDTLRNLNEDLLKDINKTINDLFPDISARMANTREVVNKFIEIREKQSYGGKYKTSKN